MGLLEGFEHFVTESEPLAPHTWLRLGGPAEYFAEPTNAEELAALVRRCREEDVPVRLLGGGSNVLVRDEGAAGMTIRLAAPAFCEISVAGQAIVAGGGARLGHVISSSVREGLAGLEPLIGVPGTVGGALHGNTGSQGTDIGQWVASATVLTHAGEILERSREDMQFAYRQSSLNELAILGARFALEPDDPRELTKRFQKMWIVKRSRLPTTDQNVGRIFKNPIGYRAAELIEEAGLQGARIGEAEICDRHANFIVANRGATSGDVLRLIDLIRDQVSQRLAIDLELEIQIW